MTPGSAKPRRLVPMKAVLTDHYFSDRDWVYERKLDGIRCIAYRDGDDVRLVSRTDHALNYPEVSEALAAERSRDFIVDGEVVAVRGGRSSFEALQQYRLGRARIFLYVFDLIWLDGRDLRERPLLERKAALRDAIAFEGPLRFTQHRKQHGERYHREACEKGWEGLIAKRADSPYVSKRSRDWLKFKCSHEQELVIGGFTAPKGSREEFGALLVGYFDGSVLRYAGKVGTGFTQETLRELGAGMRELERDSSPFDEVRPLPRSARWVEPELVAQIGFTEWTRDGRLRHPRFLGLREDKPAREVVREEPS